MRYGNNKFEKFFTDVINSLFSYCIIFCAFSKNNGENIFG